MKFNHSLPVLFICLSAAFTSHAQESYSRQPLQEQSDEWDDASWSPPDQDSTGLPGDNFSLQGALSLFKQSNSPEEFEKLLNSENNKVNNLDLNGDGNIDYLRVINKRQNQVQVFIIQALISNQESQDVAVIELEKTGDNTAVIQIAGDEDIYGETTISEPVEVTDNVYPDDADRNSYFNGSNSRVHGPAADVEIPVLAPTRVIVNVWFWPCVRRVYAPSYMVWTSPWTWVNPPVWWRPWRPMPVYAYRPVCHHYRYGYAYAPVRRIPPARVMYYPTRTYSGMVYSRNRVIVSDYRSTRADRGHYPNRYPGGRYNNNNGPRGNYNGYNNNGRPYDNRNGYRDNSPRNNWSDNRNNNSPRPGIRENYPGRDNNSPRGNDGYRPTRGNNNSGGGRNGGSYQTPPRSNTPSQGTPGGRNGGNNNGGGRGEGRAGRTRN